MYFDAPAYIPVLCDFFCVHTVPWCPNSPDVRIDSCASGICYLVGARQTSGMEVFTLEHLRAAVELSSMCMGIFDDETGRVTCPNQALRESVKLEEFSVTVTSQSDDRMYGRLKQQDLPVSLRVVSGRSPAYLVEVYLAHSKHSSRSDVIQLVEMTSDGVWEWFPSLQYEFMSERFWSILGYDHRVMPSSPEGEHPFFFKAEREKQPRI